MKKKIAFTSLSFLIFSIAFLFTGVYYDYYEGYSSALISGMLTPSLSFNDFFYYGYIGYVNFFSILYKSNNVKDWYSIISYSLIIVSLFSFLSNLTSRSKIFFWIAVVSVSVFFSENFILLNINRISFLLAFASLLYIYKAHTISIKKLTLTLAFLMYTCGYFYRLEPAILSFVIVIFSSVYLGFISITPTDLKRLIFLSIYPTILILMVSLWFKVDINNSNEFYKLIEPDVEYELMTRDNIVDIAKMTNYRDSLRYEAVYNGIWGDAATNDADFLRSLIGNKKSNILSADVFDKGWFQMVEMSKKTGLIHYVIVLFFILNLIYFAVNEQRRLPGLILYQITFLVLLIVVGGYVKMTEPALSALYFINFFTLLLLLSSWYHKIELPFLKATIGLILISVSILKLHELNEVSLVKKNEVIVNKEKLNFIKQVASGKKLYLSGESLSVFFHSYQPFEKLDITNFKGLYIFNSLAMSTIRPYKDYLDLECNCQSNDYASLFTAMKYEGNEAVILMSEETKDFLEEYMAGVHNMKVEFMADKSIFFNTSNNYSAGFRNEKSIYFYSIL